MATTTKRSKCLRRCSIGLSIFTLVTGLAMIPLLSYYIHSILVKEVVLKEGSFVYNAWKSPPFPIYFEFYFFNVVNRDEVVNEGAKIAVEERGPYTYRLISDKTNITFNDNGTVSYVFPTTYVFDRERSVGPDTEEVTTVNMILMTMVTNLRYEYKIVQNMTANFLELIGGTDPFMTQSVRHLLWGYPDHILSNVKIVLEILGIPPDQFNDQFGFFINLNNSNDGLWNMNTGANDVNKIYNINYWNGKKSVDYWSDKDTNKIVGTDGNLFHPLIKKTDTPTFFFEQLCRSMYVKYAYEHKVKGVRSYRFVQPPDMFDNTEANKGYCTPLGDCLPNGLYNISNCRHGSPFSMSLPHFLFADEEVQNGIVGLRPNVKLHQPYVDLMPDIGALVNTERKYQINAYIRNIPYLKKMSKLQDVYFPVFWFNESTILDDDWSNFIINKYQTPVAIVKWIPYIVTILGFVCTCLSSLYVYRKHRKQKQRSEETDDKKVLVNENVEEQSTQDVEDGPK